MNIRKIHDLVLRGLLGCTWMFAFLMAFFELMYSTDADDSSTYLTRCGVCLVIGVIAAIMHGKMISEEIENAEDD